MQKIELSVHEFMTIMGTMDETYGGRMKAPDESVYAHWYTQWKAMDERLESLGLMERADMLFDGKVAINALSEAHFQELLKSVRGQVKYHGHLIADGDEDGDEEELNMWEERLAELQAMHDSAGWQNQG